MSIYRFVTAEPAEESTDMDELNRKQSNEEDSDIDDDFDEDEDDDDEIVEEVEDTDV